MPVTGPSDQWLERANRFALIARLLPGTVHDVNNLLQGISGNAELLEPGAGVDETVARRGRVIGASARRASAVLSDLMAFARDVSEGVRRVDLSKTAERALAMRQYALGTARIQAGIDAPDAPVVAVASPSAVLQITLNLVVNAEQALAGRASGRVRIGVASQGERAELTVADDGAGVPPERRATLFQTDFDRAPEGLGVGLAVSAWLARAQGGTLSCVMPAAGGCAMTLSLPAAR
jgi:C4-dicarboxylate-specific signal transduction histidine kinase